MAEKRFELIPNLQGQVDIIDHIESKEKNAICIYNDLGVLPFTSASSLCDLLNALHEENIKLQARNKYLATKIQRERNIHVKEHEKWEEEIQKENDELKQQLSEQASQIDFLKDENQHMRTVLEENKQLKEELEQCRAVIDNRWIEYLKEKELEE